MRRSLLAAVGPLPGVGWGPGGDSERDAWGVCQFPWHWGRFWGGSWAPSIPGYQGMWVLLSPSPCEAKPGPYRRWVQDVALGGHWVGGRLYRSPPGWMGGSRGPILPMQGPRHASGRRIGVNI